MVCYGASRSGTIRFGMAWPGGFERNWACYGVVRSGKAGHDPVWRGYLRVGHSLSDPSIHIATVVQSWRDEPRYGMVRPGKVRQSWAGVWFGRA